MGEHVSGRNAVKILDAFFVHREKSKNVTLWVLEACTVPMA